MDYWQKRNLLTQQALSNKSVKQTERQLAKYYSQAMKKVIDDFESTYEKLLNTIEDGRKPAPADLYKLDKYWKMQGQLRHELELLGNRQMTALSNNFTSLYLQVYEGLEVEGSSMFVEIDREAAEQLINQVWCADGKNWSSRIWTNTDKLQQTLNDQLLDCVINGKKTTELKKLLQERFEVSYSAADSLVRTEIAHIQTQAARDRYINSGVKEVEVWADKDERRCEVCGKLHQKRFPIGSKMPVPAHPRCRCTIIPVIEKNTQLQKNTGALDMVVDEFVPCLKDAKTGEIFPTVVEHIDTKALKGYNKTNGWHVNWQQLAREGYDVQAVKLKGNNDVEGLIALKLDTNAQAVYIGFLESAPHNSAHNPNKRYVGVGGHLFAIAAEEAMNKSNGNMYAFAAKEELREYYCNELFAEYIGILHPHHVVWDAYGCNELLKVYNYERQ